MLPNLEIGGGRGGGKNAVRPTLKTACCMLGWYENIDSGVVFSEYASVRQPLLFQMSKYEKASSYIQVNNGIFASCMLERGLLFLFWSRFSKVNEAELLQTFVCCLRHHGCVSVMIAWYNNWKQTSKRLCISRIRWSNGQPGWRVLLPKCWSHMKENPTLSRLQDSSYSNGHFTGKHNHIICGSVGGRWVKEWARNLTEAFLCSSP